MGKYTQYSREELIVKIESLESENKFLKEYIRGTQGFKDIGKYTDSELDSEEEFIQLFGFCGCGRPEKVMLYIRDYLLEVSKDISKRDMKDDAAYWMAAYLCDDKGLTEHGSSVAGAWLTDLGREWLEKLNKYKEEE